MVERRGVLVGSEIWPDLALLSGRGIHHSYQSHDYSDISSLIIHETPN